jgi:hypothetical protein
MEGDQLPVSRTSERFAIHASEILHSLSSEPKLCRESEALEVIAAVGDR